MDQGLVQRLRQEGNGRVAVEYHRETGKVRFVGAAPGQPITRAASVAATARPADAARGFMGSYGPLFGVQDQARDLAVKRERQEAGGRSTVRFAQRHNGVPVFAGEVVVTLDQSQNVQAAIGELLPDIDVDTTPKVGKDAARAAALAVVGQSEPPLASRLTASEPELWIYNRALVGDPGPKITQLVWRMEVKAGLGDPIRYLVLIDAHDGTVALTFNQVADARNRNTFDLNHDTASGTLVCNEANPTCAGQVQDAVDAHRYTGDTYDFYQSRHGRDSLDGAGMALKSFVRYDSGYQNAFWSGTEMVYGDGFPHADDVVGHELTHGVTEFESGLLYFRQSGAINESLSDIWGEFVDLTNSGGTDDPSVRWLMGEDLPGAGVPGSGMLRNMANPPAFDHPDRVRSPLWWSSHNDNGGVHINSGVNNKAASLLADGGTFNGKTVTGLGIDKVVKIYYEAQTNLLTPGSDYADLYTALQQACANLTTTGVTTVTDCQQVVAAIQAVEMNLEPVSGAAVQAPVCPAGQSPVNAFFDDLEDVSTTQRNFQSPSLNGVNGWEYPPPPQYRSTTSGTKNLHARNNASQGTFMMERTGDLTLPPNAFLRFNHAWSFGMTPSNPPFLIDGGILEYSTDGGANWSNASSLPMDGGYNGTLIGVGLGSTNPLAGQDAWAGSSDYGSSRVNLATLAGQPFRFRFTLGTDGRKVGAGWFIDDIRVYTCSAGGPPAGVTVTPTSGLTTTEAGGSATFTVALNTVPTDNVTIALASSDPTEGTVSPPSLVFTPLNALTPQTVTVKGVDDGDQDGNVAYTIVTAPATSGDGTYNTVDPADVSVTNIDNEPSAVTHPVTVTVVGNGSVSATGIACGSDCSEGYPAGTRVTLVASPAPGWTFSGWSGACSGAAACRLTVDGAKNVTATFQASVPVSVGQAPGTLPNGDKVLTATLSARPGCGAITSARFGSVGVPLQNASVSITAPADAPQSQTTGFGYTPPAGTTSISLSLQRSTPTGSATVPIVVSYASCDDWHTFVGGGPEAFR